MLKSKKTQEILIEKLVISLDLGQVEAWHKVSNTYKLKLTKTQSIELMVLSENFKKNNGLIADLDFYFKQSWIPDSFIFRSYPKSGGINYFNGFNLSIFNWKIISNKGDLVKIFRIKIIYFIDELIAFSNSGSSEDTKSVSGAGCCFAD